ncbi:hypothetical protein ACTTAI_00390 (plasmid) [Rhodobacter capsulatus]|uniref:hypothetical protein n=1 Tax=Rhodobacter capsulatus TaxID=1061 RepID=UPI004025BB1F
MRYLRWFVACIAIHTGTISTAIALELDARLSNTGATFVLDGVIEPGDADRFKAYYEEKADGFSFAVALNSPGGNMAEGIRLGRLFRELGIDTYVIKYPRRPANMGQFDYSAVQAIPGAQCASACALAFMWGIERIVLPGGAVGLHQFYGGDPQLSYADTMASTQTTSAIVALYLREMGASPELFERMSITPPDQLFIPTPEELSALGITTTLAFQGFRLMPKDGEIVATATNPGNATALERVYEVETFCWKGHPMINLYAESAAEGLPPQMANPDTTHFKGFWVKTRLGNKSFGNESARYYADQRLLATLILDPETALALATGPARFSVNSYTSSGVFLSAEIDGGQGGDEAIRASFKGCLP